MAGSGVTLYANNAAGNKAIVGTIDWRENIYMPSQINDNLAQIMADIRAMANSVAGGWIEIGDGDGTYTATYVSATSFQFSGIDVTAYYRAGMRVRVVAPTPGTLSGTITSVAFTTNTVITVAWDSGAGLSNEAITSVSIGVGSGGGATAPASYRNILGRNGGMEVWQRGAGGSAGIAVAASGQTYTVDGWFLVVGANQASVAWQVAGIAPGSRYAAQIQRNAVQTGTTQVVLEYPLDSDEVAAMRSNPVTLSVTLQAGANWSPASGNLSLTLYIGTGSPARRTAAVYTGETTPIAVTQAITATATRYSFTSTIPIAAGAAQGSLALAWTPVGTAGANDSVFIDDVQLEIGSVATPFERRPFESELAACQRHCCKSFDYAVAPATALGVGANFHTFTAPVAGAGANVSPSIVWPVRMRTAPTITLYNPAAANAQVRDATNSVDCSGSIATAQSDRHAIVVATGNAATSIGSQLRFCYLADAGI